VSERCGAPVPDERLLDYLLGELEPGADEEVESHLFACASCASAAERLAGLATALNQAVSPILAPPRFEALDRAGLVSRVDVMTPGSVAEVRYPPSGKVLVIRLGGADIKSARRVDVDLRTAAGEPVVRLDDVPFDSSRGEVLVACQRRYAETFPRDLVFAVEVVEGDARKRVGEYTVLHRLA
jgi:anti-sigma factor RsiW